MLYKKEKKIKDKKNGNLLIINKMYINYMVGKIKMQQHKYRTE